MAWIPRHSINRSSFLGFRIAAIRDSYTYDLAPRWRFRFLRSLLILFSRSR